MGIMTDNSIIEYLDNRKVKKNCGIGMKTCCLGNIGIHSNQTPYKQFDKIRKASVISSRFIEAKPKRTAL
jgi:hypothetical protein